MSAYTCFFVKRYDVYIPIGSFSRSSIISRFFDAPWEKCIPLSVYRLKDIGYEIRDYKQKVLNSIKKYKENIRFISELNNPLEEKMEMIDNYEEYITEAEEELEDCDIALNFCFFLQNILYEGYMDSIDKDNFIYFGEECDDPMNTAGEENGE